MSNTHTYKILQIEMLQNPFSKRFRFPLGTV